MLRALLERDIVPDLVLGTSVGALNGAMVARQPELAVVDRLTDLWVATAQGRDVYGDRPLRTVRRAVSTGTHIYSPSRCAPGWRRSSATRASRTSRCGSRCARRASSARPSTGSPRARRAGGPRQRRRARPAAAGRGRRRALPRRRPRQLDPGGPGGRARRHPGLRAPGRPDRPAAAGADAGRGRWRGCASRSPAGTGSRATWRRSPTASRPTCCPPRGTSPRDDSLLGLPRLRRACRRRIDATYDASRRLPRRRSSAGHEAPARVGPPSAGARPGGGRADGADVADPAGAGCWSPPRSRRCCPAGGGRCACCGWSLLYAHLRDRCCWSCCSGCGWPAASAGRSARRTSRGIHYDLVQGTLSGPLPRGPPGAARCAIAHRRAARRRAPGRADAGDAAATPGPATRSC